MAVPEWGDSLKEFSSSISNWAHGRANLDPTAVNTVEMAASFDRRRMRTINAMFNTLSDANKTEYNKLTELIKADAPDVMMSFIAEQEGTERRRKMWRITGYALVAVVVFTVFASLGGLSGLLGGNCAEDMQSEECKEQQRGTSKRFGVHQPARIVQRRL